MQHDADYWHRFGCLRVRLVDSESRTTSTPGPGTPIRAGWCVRHLRLHPRSEITSRLLSCLSPSIGSFPLTDSDVAIYILPASMECRSSSRLATHMQQHATQRVQLTVDYFCYHSPQFTCRALQASSLLHCPYRHYRRGEGVARALKHPAYAQLL